MQWWQCQPILLQLFADIVLCVLHFWHSIMHRKVSHLNTFSRNPRQSCCWMRPDLWFCKDLSAFVTPLHRPGNQRSWFSLWTTSPESFGWVVGSRRTNDPGNFAIYMIWENLTFSKSLRFWMFIQVRSPFKSKSNCIKVTDILVARTSKKIRKPKRCGYVV